MKSKPPASPKPPGISGPSLPILASCCSCSSLPAIGSSIGRSSLPCRSMFTTTSIPHRHRTPAGDRTAGGDFASPWRSTIFTQKFRALQRHHPGHADHRPGVDHPHSVSPTVTGVVLTLVAVALGEITQSPRYYEYISRLAPSGQQGTYMGFAFLPLGIGSLIGGNFGGFLIHHYGEVQHRPGMMWGVITAIGLLTAVLLWIYDRFVLPKEVATKTS